jgi:O-antigen ligase
VVERHPSRWPATAVLTALAAVALWLAPAADAAHIAGSNTADPAPSASQPSRQLIAFLRSPAGVVTVGAALAFGGVAWTVGVAGGLKRLETEDRVPKSKSALRRVRGRRRADVAGRPAGLATVHRTLSGLVTAAALILPITFSIVINEDVFALPKTVGLWAFGIVIAITLIALLVLGARPSRPGVLELSAIAYIALTAIATLASVDPGLSVVGERLQYQGLISTVACLALFAAAAISLTTVPRVRILALAVLASSTVAAIYALAQWFGLDPIWSELYKGRVFSTVGQANALATTLAAGTIVALALAPRSGRLQRAAIVGCVALCVAGLVFTFSRGGYVAFALGLLVAGLVLVPGTRRVAVRPRAGRRFALAAAATLVVGLLALAWQPAAELVGRVAARTASIADTNEGSNRAHLDLWTVGLRIAIDHPALGTGPDTYATVFPEYRDVVLAPDSAAKMARFRPESPHNVYLAIASGAGFPALVAYVVLVGSCLVLGVRAARRAAMPARLALAGLLGALAVHLITIVFMTAEPATFTLFWILLGALAGLARRPLAAGPDKEKAPAR